MQSWLELWTWPHALARSAHAYRLIVSETYLKQPCQIKLDYLAPTADSRLRRLTHTDKRGALLFRAVIDNTLFALARLTIRHEALVDTLTLREGIDVDDDVASFIAGPGRGRRP